MSKLSKIASLSATPNFQHPAAEFLAESNCTIDKITESIKILTENAERIKFFVDGDDIEMVENYVLSCGHLFAFFEGIEIKVPYICNYDINHDEFTSCWLNNESDSDESFTITVDGKIQQYCDEEEIQLNDIFFSLKQNFTKKLKNNVHRFVDEFISTSEPPTTMN